MGFWDWFKPKPKPKPPDPPAAALACRLSVWADGALTTAGIAVLEPDQYPGVALLGGLAPEDPRFLWTLPAGTLPGWGAWLTLRDFDGYRDVRTRVILGPDLADQWLESAAPARRSADARVSIKASFCNLRDAAGRVMFSPFLAPLAPAERQDWYDRWRADGCTHIVLSPTCSYPGSPIPAFDWYGDPARFAALVREVLATPAADGLAFTPILILDGGGPNIRSRIAAYWQGIRDAVGEDASDVIVCPGWELVTAGEVSSAEYSDALETLHAHGWPHIWAHLSQGRAACSSNPVEPDDPWQGAEAACWTSHGGQHVEGLLFQAETTRPDDDLLPLPTPYVWQGEGWLDRWNDVIPRVGLGINGWRRMHLCFFESQAYYYYRGQSDSAFCKRLAARAQALADAYGCPVGMGNGLP